MSAFVSSVPRRVGVGKMAVATERLVECLVPTVRQKEGGGFIVRRPNVDKKRFDPILMLDHMGPAKYGPREAVGAPDHPHRGQETITYIIQGEMQHLDSHGHKGTLGRGDVQWMTAGAGVVHSEMPGDEVYEKGGTIEGFQMWVNLPSDKKMTAPRYQELKSNEIPAGKSDDGLVTVKVIAGRYKDIEAAVDTITPIVYYDIFSDTNGSVTVDPDVERVFAYVYKGDAMIGGKNVKEGQLVVFEENSNGSVSFVGGASGFGALLFGGKPLHEPISWHGPFVMNTREQIMDAFRDYSSGKLGSIPGAEGRFRQTEDANRTRQA